MTDQAISQRANELKPLVDQVRDELHRQLSKYGIDAGVVSVPTELGYCELRRDSFDGSEPFYAEWHDAKGRKLGEIIVQASGQFFAEFDVLQNHPTDKRWYIEAVTAWGKPGVVKSELRLLEALPA